MIQKNSRLRQCLWAVSIVFLTALGTPVAHAKGAIESVSGFLQGGGEVLRIELSEAPGDAPTGFSIQSPPRIALDFPDVANATGLSSIDINQGNIKSANIVQAGTRSRVVLNLKQAAPYRTEVHGKTVVVLLEPVTGGAAVPSAVPTVFAESQNTDVLPLKDLDFRRGADGAGRVIVGLGSNQVGVDMEQQGKGLTVEFLRSSLPEGLRRRLDVSDFGTPIQAVSVKQNGERVRMTIEAVGDWESSAYQSDDQFVVEVRPKKIDPSKLTQGPSYSGEKLSLNFQNIEVRSLLQVIADFTNFNIVTSDTVTGSLTLRLKDVPWDQALQIIMDSRGLGMRKTGTVLWIAPKDEIDERTKKDYEAIQQIQKLVPLRTQSYQLNYAKATDMVTQLTTTNNSGSGNSNYNNRFLSDRGNAIAEPRTNQLFVTDTPEKLEAVQQLLLKLDVPVRQVMIEARIVEANDTFGRSLGVRLGGGDLRAQNGGNGGYSLSGNNRLVLGTNYANATASAGAGGTVDTTGNFVNLPATLTNTNGSGTFALSIFNSAANRFLTLELSAMEADGLGKIISSPRLVTADQTKALIEQGTEIPYANTAPNGATTISFKNATLSLQVTPQITPEGNIILDLDIHKDAQGATTPQGIAIDTRHIVTQVLVENGGTVVIGGIFTSDEESNVSKVPFLGDVPVVGNLFKSTTKTLAKYEMLVFITPKVIADRGPAR